MPLEGRSKIGDGELLRRGDWLSGVAVAMRASRVAIAEARMRSLRVVDRVYLMGTGLGE